MDFCLYDPDRGYYASKENIFGPEGDYYTTPSVHPFLAHCLTEAAAYYFEQLGRPQCFHLVELGSGQGILGQNLLLYLRNNHPKVFERTQYIPLEITSPDLPDEISGFVFSNEFFDALPVHRVLTRSSELQEIYVQIGDQISEVEGEVSDSRIWDYMKIGFGQWNDGYEYEVNLRMVEILEELDARLKSGAILTIDYGYSAEDYICLDHPQGTMMCYYRHQAHANPYVNLGLQDITSHVNFEVLAKTGERLGWENGVLQTQRQFLLDYGLKDYLCSEEAHGFFNAERVEERLRLKALLFPGGISDTMKVMEQRVRLE